MGIADQGHFRRLAYHRAAPLPPKERARQSGYAIPTVPDPFGSHETGERQSNPDHEAQ